MNVSNAIIEIRNKINDRDEVGLDDEELLSYLNEAIQYISNFLSGEKSPIVVKEMEITEPTAVLPAGFTKTAGNFPIKRTGNTIQLLCDPPVKIRYFANMPLVEMNDNMPFEYETLNRVAIRIACIYANIQEQTDVSQDKQALNEMNAVIVSALSM